MARKNKKLYRNVKEVPDGAREVMQAVIASHKLALMELCFEQILEQCNGKEHWMQGQIQLAVRFQRRVVRDHLVPKTEAESEIDSEF